MGLQKISVAKPAQGELIEVIGGPADGRRVPFTGTEMIYAELSVPHYIGDSTQPPDLGQIRLQHPYQLWRQEHAYLGIERWVYRYEGTETP